MKGSRQRAKEEIANDAVAHTAQRRQITTASRHIEGVVGDVLRAAIGHPLRKNLHAQGPHKGDI